jgi:uncharacterized membrane protein
MSKFVSDSPVFFKSLEFDQSVSVFTDSVADAIKDSQIGLIIGVVSSLLILIGLFIIFLILVNFTTTMRNQWIFSIKTSVWMMTIIQRMLQWK